MIKVMIVEDDPMVAEINRRYVEMVGGFSVMAMAHCSDEAFSLLRKDEFDLILLDIFMPGMNGIELLMRLRRIGKGADVIIISAACDRQNIKKALQFGAVDYIIKPFEFERLNTALLAYKGLAGLMDGQDHLSQAELDKCILRKKEPVSAHLPKGIDKNTLKKVCDQINTLDQKLFSTEEMAGYIGISRVSMRKYLEFLRQKNFLKLELIYGAVGRPVYKYRCNSAESKIIRQYLDQ
ncbi:response regulator [Pectinatus haikarae]|uniref:response regulator n=1 Tax=Pectinatus haikarae TaxID=349096 RepID=UPI0018C72EF2|nr:response regulator [Pectinatus haikarae]